jgi:hypothetical protein
MIGLPVASGLMEESVDEAIAVLEGIEDPGLKAIGLIDASHKLGVQDRSRVLAVLDRALLSARAAREPDGMNLVLLGQVAERFLDLGQAERGRALLREGEALAKQLPKAGFVGYARGSFAEELAQIDLEAALALTKDLPGPFEFDRHHGNIAHELAAKEPAQADRVLAMVRNQRQRDDYTVRVAYRMAPVDLARARRLVDSIADDGLKGYALGVMALRLIEADARKDKAREVLDAAYESLERSTPASRAKVNSIYAVTSIAPVLLAIAERVDSDLVDEYLWRCLALRPPRPWQSQRGGQGAQEDVYLAMMLARYDREIARSLVDPLAAGPAAALLSNRGEHYAAAAAIDPKWAVALVEALPDDGDLKIQSPKNSARLAVATLLGRTGEQRFRKLQNSFLYLWVPDTEDINPND